MTAREAARQDRADGEALRRLREALRGHEFARMTTPYADSGDVSVDPFEVDVEGYGSDRSARGKGATIAGAADAARAALGEAT